MANPIIIVLGHFMDKTGQLNKESRLRLDLAIEVSHQNKNSLIITSGWDYFGEYNIAIADSMKSYIVSNSNISNDLILTETSSRDTVGDAIFTKINLVKKIGLNNLLIVTSDYHVKRVKKIFSFIYGEQYTIKVLGSKTFKNNELSESEDKSLNQFYKTFNGVKSGDDILIYNRLCSDHPYYNGNFYPKI
tara:strand:+ start:45 stop:614 length:570 start_codon:yes stop_codon:yes gene_type:complete